MASHRQSPGSEPQSPQSNTLGYPLEVAPEEMMPGPSESYGGPWAIVGGRKRKREQLLHEEELEEEEEGEEEEEEEEETLGVLEMMSHAAGVPSRGWKMRMWSSPEVEEEQKPEYPAALEKVEEEEEEKGDAASQAQHSGLQASPRPQGAVRRKRDESEDEEQQEDKEQPCGLHRKRQRQESPVLPEHHQVFRKLLEDPVIKRFLAWDRHLLVSDKYLLAIVIAYFSRSGLFSWQIRRIHFFLALYLANDMEEDNQAHKQNIFDFLYGHSRLQRPLFYRLRLQLLRSMGWRAWVTREECEQIQAYDPELWVWGRDRANLP